MSCALELIKGITTAAYEGRIEDGLALSESAEEYAEGTEHEALAHYAHAQMLLASGDYKRGFKKALRRWEVPHETLNFTHAQLENVPRWKGESLRDKRVLVYSEMGLGDILMLLRYVKPIREMCQHVTLQVPRGMETLVRGCADWVVPTLDCSYLKSFSFRIPLFDIPAYLEDPIIPSTGYISGFPERMPRILPETEGPKVGIAWSGKTGRSVTRIRENFRSMPIGKVMDKALELFPGATFYSVQNQDQEQGLAVGVEVSWFEDFFETACLMKVMDAIVTIDSSPVHLAGAIGHPNIHLLLDQGPDWRWYNPDRWYPGITIHRFEQ